MVEITVPNFPFDVSRGTHTVPLTSTVFVDATDVRLVDSKEFYGFAPQKIVGLKYTGYRVFVERIESTTNAAGKIK